MTERIIQCAICYLGGAVCGMAFVLWRIEEALREKRKP